VILALYSAIIFPCLTRAIKVVESFSFSYSGYQAVSVKLHLGQRSIYEKDHSSSDDADGKLSNVQPIDFDWEYIAEYVFDTSVDIISESEEVESEIHQHSKPIILFDGVCNLCNSGVNFAIDHDEAAKFRFASLQSAVAKSLLLREGKDPLKSNDVVLVTKAKVYYSSDAVANIMTGLDSPWLRFIGRLGQLAPSFVRDIIYKFVSGNRFVLGENDSCRLDLDGDLTSRFVSDPILVTKRTKEESKEEKENENGNK